MTVSIRPLAQITTPPYIQDSVQSSLSLKAQFKEFKISSKNYSNHILTLTRPEKLEQLNNSSEYNVIGENNYFKVSIMMRGKQIYLKRNQSTLTVFYPMSQSKFRKNKSQHGAASPTNKQNKQLEVKIPTLQFITSFNQAFSLRWSGA